jgi:mono/diheme cytochrome c family protein
VAGESWIRHLGFDLQDSAFGQVGEWGPAVASHPESGIALAAALLQRGHPEPLLTGRDLYEIDCQSCHKPDGTGVPPEINSLIGPVQAASPEFLRSRMERRGFSVDARQIRDLATQSQKAILDRLQKGGHWMPAFSQLDARETRALLSYLRVLAGVPGAEGRVESVEEPRLRLGELLVKGTCHICHDATGPGTDSDPRLGRIGRIPSLARIPRDLTVDEVIRKVRRGWPVADPHIQRGEMPIFGYLTPAEIEDAYEYLSLYPPGEGSVPPTATASRTPRPTVRLAARLPEPHD